MGLAYRAPDFEVETAPNFVPPEALPGKGAARERRGPLRPSKLAPSRVRLSPWTLKAAFRLADGFALAVSVLGVASFWDRPAHVVPTLAVGGLVLAWALGAVDAHDLAARESLRRHALRLASAFGLAAIALGVIAAGFGGGAATRALPAWLACAFAFLSGLHLMWWRQVTRWRREGRLTPTLVVVGATANARRLIERLLASGNAAVLGIFDDRLSRAPADVGGAPVLGDLDALIDHPLTPFVDRIVITVSSFARSRIDELVERLGALPNEVMLFVDHDDEAGETAAFSRIVNAPLTRVAGGWGCERRAFVKRLFDILAGSLVFAAALPVMLVVAAAVRLDSPGPVFFRQRREGFNNETIEVIKFRSMRASGEDARRAAERQVCPSDPRITRVGRFIRRTSLDELPQLINVLRGEMSLVGPRPHALGMKTGEAASRSLVARYAHRHRIKPGITGWAAIHGSRGPVATPETLRRRVALDIEYIERQSLWLDLYIMLLTVPCMLGDRQAVR